LGFIVIQQGATDAQDTAQVQFIQAGKFGSTSSGAGGSGAGQTTLQQAYENTTDGTIIRDATRGGLTITNGDAGQNTDVHFEVLDFAQTQNFAVTGQGRVSISAGRDALGYTDLELVPKSYVDDNYSGTGWLSGGELTFTASTLDYAVQPGSGVITNNGVSTLLEWNSALTATLPAPTGRVTTFISVVDSGGGVAAIQVDTTRPTRSTERTQIFIGVLVHFTDVAINLVNNQQYTMKEVGNQLLDLYNVLGFMNVSGNEPSGSTAATLELKVAPGEMLAAGSNVTTDDTDPHVKQLNGMDTANWVDGVTETAATGFQYRCVDGTSGYLYQQFLIPGFYEDEPGTNTIAAGDTGSSVAGKGTNVALGGTDSLASVGNNEWTVQRIYAFTSSSIKLQFGQTTYTSSASAIAGVTSDAFTTEPSIAGNGLLIGYIVIKGNCTDSTDVTQCIFLSAGKFGGANSVSGTALATLASAGGTESLVNDGTGPDLAVKGLSAGAGVALSSDANQVTVACDQTLQETYDQAPTANPHVGTGEATGLRIRQTGVATNKILTLQESGGGAVFDVDGNGVAAGATLSASTAFDGESTAKVINLVDPTAAQDGATKNYVDTLEIPYDMIVACSDESTAIDSTGVKVTTWAARSFTITGIKGYLKTADTAGPFTVDVHVNLSTVMAVTKLVFGTGTTATGTVSTSAVTEGHKIEFEVDAVGDGVATGLTVVIQGKIAALAP
jgi:hypothetical protein